MNTKERMNLLSKIVDKHFRKNEAAAIGTDAYDDPILQMSKTVFEIGYPALRDVFARKVTLEAGATSFVVPVTSSLATSVDANYTAANVTFMPMSYVKIDVDKNVGLNVGWTREYLEDCAWSAIEPQLKEVGRSIEQKVFAILLAHLIADVDTGNDDATWTKNADFDFDAFIAGIALIAAQDFTCDTLILHPDEYYQLLADDRFINVSVMGSADPIRTGRIATTLGVTVFCSSLMTQNEALFFDSTKAIVLAMIREEKVEEYSYPDQNLYGLVGSVRFGSEVICKKAIALVKEAA